MNRFCVFTKCVFVALILFLPAFSGAVPVLITSPSTDSRPAPTILDASHVTWGADPAREALQPTPAINEAPKPTITITPLAESRPAPVILDASHVTLGADPARNETPQSVGRPVQLLSGSVPTTPITREPVVTPQVDRTGNPLTPGVVIVGASTSYPNEPLKKIPNLKPNVIPAGKRPPVSLYPITGNIVGPPRNEAKKDLNSPAICADYPQVLLNRQLVTRNLSLAGGTKRVNLMTTVNTSLAEQEIALLTTQLLQSSNTRKIGLKSPKATSETVDFNAIVQERKNKMLALAEENPAGFLRAALSQSQRNTLPTALRTDVENKTSTTGKLRTLYKTNPNETGETTEYYLKNSKSTYKLKIADGAELDTRPGTNITVNGTNLGNTIVTENKNNITPQSNPVSLQSDPGPNTDALGTQKIAIILTKPAGPVKYPVTQLDAVMREVNKYFQEVSYGQTTLQWDVYGWYDTDLAPDEMEYPEKFMEYADKDIDYSKYNIIMSVDQRQSFMAYVGKASTYTEDGDLYLGLAYVNQRFFPRPEFDSSVAHELAHTFGAGHSGNMSCGSKSIDFLPNCTLSEYGDIFDIMGGNSDGHLNSIQKDRVGWLTGKVVDVSKSGDYTVSALESMNGPVAIRIPKTKEASTTGDYYYLEYRTPRGFDVKGMASQSVKGVQIRVNYGVTQLVDMTPGNYPADVALGENMVFKDPFGVVITTKKVTDDSVTVNVAFLDELCKA